MPLTIRLTAPAHPLSAEAAELLDQSRQHYGANPAPEVVAEWIGDLVTSDRMRVYGAGPGHVDGICTAAVIPGDADPAHRMAAADRYVDPDVRRGGVARALLGRVAEAARAEGAHRLSLQTEAGNPRALELYAKAGFERVGEALLHRFL